MLDSQRQVNIRNIPQNVPAVIRTKEPPQVMTEEALLAGWPDDAKAYRKRVEKQHPNTGRKFGSAKPGEKINDQVLAVLSQTEWMNVTQVRDATGYGYNKARNALDRLVSKREIDRRIVPNSDGMRNKTYYRINPKSAYRRERNDAMLEYMAEPRGVPDLASFSGLSHQRVSYMLGEWLEQGIVQREWTSGNNGRGTNLWRRKEGGE